MDGYRLKDLHVKPRRPAVRERIWREWCFFRACIKHRGLSLLLLTTLLLVGGCLFYYLEPEKNHTFAQAVYYTFSLIFGEPPEEFPASHVLQAMFFLVPLLGLGVLLEAIVEIANMLQDRKDYERSWCTIMAESMKKHIILVGMGRLGYSTYKLLRELGEPIVVIEADPNNQFLEDVRRDGMPLLIGDARREAILEDANVRKASSIILGTSDDLANLEVGLDARKINPDIRVVMRMFDPNMAAKIRDGFDISTAMSQALIAAPAFATAAVEPRIVSSMVVDDELVITLKWQVRPGGPLCHKAVAEVMNTLQVGVLERRASDGSVRLFPGPDVTLEPGDELLVQGLYTQLKTLLHADETPEQAADRKREARRAALAAVTGRRESHDGVSG